MSEPSISAPDIADNFGGSADDFYEALIAAHAGLSDDESAALNARLILVLANEVGDIARLRVALAVARERGKVDNA